MYVLLRCSVAFGYCDGEVSYLRGERGDGCLWIDGDRSISAGDRVALVTRAR